MTIDKRKIHDTANLPHGADWLARSDFAASGRGKVTTILFQHYPSQQLMGTLDAHAARRTRNNEKSALNPYAPDPNPPFHVRCPMELRSRALKRGLPDP